MSVTDKARPLSGGAGQLETVARELFGLDYTHLDDDQASQVWDVIEERES